MRVSIYERYENSVWDARPYSLTESNPPKIGHHDERFGGTVGGPFRIPAVYDGRDKTYFFANYQADRQQGPVDTFATVPTDAERKGNFCGMGLALYNPFSNPAGPRAQLPCDLSQTMLLNPAALGLLDFLPEPNLATSSLNFHLQAVVPVDTDHVNVHVIHTISPKLSVTANYFFQSARQQSLNSFPQLLDNQNTRSQAATLGLVQNWTARLVNQTQLNFTRNRARQLNAFAFTDDIAGNLGIAGISSDPINFGIPLLSFTNFSDVNDTVPSLVRNQTWRLTDNLSLNHAKHTWQFGGEVRRMQYNTRSDPTPRGAFTFTGLMTSQLDANGQPIAGTGYDFADFLLGLPQATNVEFGNASLYFRSWGFAGYAQDDWRIHPRLTLEYGLRYDAVRPPSELFNHISNLDLNSDISAVDTVTPGVPGTFGGALPRSLIRGDYNNWGPRLGLAWRPPAGKLPLVVRAGYGIFYNEGIYQTLAFELANQPPFAEAQTRLTTSTAVLTLQDGFPPQPPSTVRNTKSVDPNYKVGYAQVWNFTLETQIHESWTIQATYTGTKGTHLDLLRAPNRAAPGSPLDTDQQRRIANASGFTYDTSGASSIYHALQLAVIHRFVHGLLFQGTYTFGKSIDNASSIGGGTPVVVQDDTNFRAERGLSSFDIRHQFHAFYLWELPFGEKKRWAHSGFAAHLLGNLRLSGNTLVTTGSPFTARVLGNAADSTGTGANFSMRANAVGNPNLPSGQRTPLHFFNTAAFRVPDAGMFGDAGRNTIEGPGTVNTNAALTRMFRFGRDLQYHLDARWEVANLFNTPNFTGLNTVVNSATYGSVQGAKPMRTMDLSLRLSF